MNKLRSYKLWAFLALFLSLGFVRYLSAQQGRIAEDSATLATSGNWLLVGEPNGESEISRGQVHFFSWDGSQWVLRQSVTPSDSEATEFFGARVAFDEDRAVIGATLYEGPTTSEAAYLFRFNGSRWEEEEFLVDNISYAVSPLAGGPTPTPIQPTPSPIVIDPDQGTQPDVVIDASGFIFGCSQSPRNVAKFDVELFMAFVLALVFFGFSKYRSRSRHF